MRSYQTGRELLGLHQRPEKEEKREINKRVESQMEHRHFSLVSCPYMQQTSLTELITEEKCQYCTDNVTVVGFFNLLGANRRL